MEERNKRKERTGVVVSDKMDKTIVVKLTRRTHHPKYEKVITKIMKVKAHDEKNEAKSGDVVRIREVRPLSKDKRWILISKEEAKGKGV
ncbi:MAG: 30S ribosomal protein S17 [Candidatus Margulisbacteria bacterium]|nr:30S ribosomal protein S17 [Candidatus Margulisiibacteriota bacterium]